MSPHLQDINPFFQLSASALDQSTTQLISSYLRAPPSGHTHKYLHEGVECYHTWRLVGCNRGHPSSIVSAIPRHR